MKYLIHHSFVGTDPSSVHYNISYDVYYGKRFERVASRSDVADKDPELNLLPYWIKNYGYSSLASAKRALSNLASRVEYNCSGWDSHIEIVTLKENPSGMWSLA